MKNICVFASSSHKLAPCYYEAAHALGLAIARAGAGLVFGAGRVGLMGAAAEGAEEGGGKIIGVLPKKMDLPGIAFERCTELIITPTMATRKEKMEELADAFIALPGGFGTLEELFEVITLRQLGYHNHPVVLLNQNGFFDPLLAQSEAIFRESFADPAFRALYAVAATPEEAVALALAPPAGDIPDKLMVAMEERRAYHA